MSLSQDLTPRRPTWIVVADEAIARVLHWPRGESPLQPVAEWTDPDAHAKGTEFRNDAHGRRGHAGQAAHGATVSAHQDERHQEAGNFARRVAAQLQQAHQQHRFESLQLIAAPRFLGELRNALSEELRQTVVESWDKDLVHLSNEALVERLRQPQQ